MSNKWPGPSEADSNIQNETDLLPAEPQNHAALPLYPESACELVAGLEPEHVGQLRNCFMKF